MKDYPISISKQCQNKITLQMNNSFYQIKITDEKYEMGFFSNINYKNTSIPVIIMTNQSSDKEDIDNINTIEVSNNYLIETIELGKTRYRNKECDLTIIEIKEIKNKKINFIQIDDNLINNELKYYGKESIYIIQSKNIDDIYISYGVINGINYSEIRFKLNIISDMKLYAIFNLTSNKLIGVHKPNSSSNKGIFLISLINGFINTVKNKEYLNIFKLNKKYKYNQILKNEINIIININEEDKYKEIYFLDNYQEKDGNYLHNKFNELNDLNTKLYINNEITKFNKYFVPREKREYKIKLKFNINLTDCSYMFAGCKNIININFISFNTENVKNMKYMFYECQNLKNINTFSFNTKNVIDMSYMFFNCRNLINLDLLCFDIKSTINLSFMFSYCNNLKQLYFPSIINNNYVNMNNIFFGCNNLSNIDLSLYKYINNQFSSKIGNNINNEILIKIKVNQRDINNEIYFLDNYKEKDGNYLHNKFSELNEFNTELYINNEKKEFRKFFVPEKEGNYDVKLKFNINLSNCNYMFAGCVNIMKIYFIYFNTEYISYMNYMFYECENLSSIDLSYFNTKNVIDMSYMFFNCRNLVSLNLYSFDIQNATNMSFMFSYSYYLKKLDFPSLKDKINNKEINLNYLFFGCDNLKNVDLSLYNNINKEYINEVDPNLKNEINIIIKATKKDINKELYFLDNILKVHKGKYLHDKFNQLNQDNAVIYINKEKKKYQKFFKPKEEGEYHIKLRFNINLTDCNFMFAGCKNIINIDFTFFNTKYITNMKGMFDECDGLKNINLSNFNTENVTSMGFMFHECSALVSLNLSSFDTKKVNNMCNSFDSCTSLKYLNLLNFHIQEETNYYAMFRKCPALKKENIITHDEKILKCFDDKYDY